MITCLELSVVHKSKLYSLHTGFLKVMVTEVSLVNARVDHGSFQYRIHQISQGLGRKWNREYKEI